MAFGHNELWRPKAAKSVSMTSQMLWPSATRNSGGLAAAKVCTKLAAKISPNGNTGRQLAPAPAAAPFALAAGWRMAPGWSSGCSLTEDEDLTNGPVYDDDYMEIFITSIP